MTYSTLRLCSGRGSYEAIPRPKLILDLARIAARLAAAGIPVTDARVMLLISMEKETTLSQDGRVLIKTGDPVVAARVFERLRSVADLPPAEATPHPPPRVPARLIPP